MKNVLYHYCSLDTFTKIIKNKTIRASDCCKTNDYSETKWISTLVYDILVQQIITYCKFFLLFDSNENVIDKVLSQICRTIDAIYSRNTRQMLTFVACFSADGDLLSQWRGYSDNGCGVSIGFDKMLLQTFDTNGYNYHFKKVIYNEKEQKQYLSNHFSDLFERYSSIEVNDIEKCDLNKLFDQFIEDLCNGILTIRNDSPLFKNYKFEEEKEWRLYINNHFVNFLYNHENKFSMVGDIEENYNMECEYKNGFRRKPVDFRTTSDMIIPYFDFDFNKVKDKLIKEVIIGPKCNASEYDINLFLAVNGYDYNKVQIKKSTSTYR